MQGGGWKWGPWACSDQRCFQFDPGVALQRSVSLNLTCEGSGEAVDWSKLPDTCAEPGNEDRGSQMCIL